MIFRSSPRMGWRNQGALRSRQGHPGVPIPFPPCLGASTSRGHGVTLPLQPTYAALQRDGAARETTTTLVLTLHRREWPCEYAARLHPSTDVSGRQVAYDHKRELGYGAGFTAEDAVAKAFADYRRETE